MKDKVTRRLIFGTDAKIEDTKGHRVTTWNFPSTKNGEWDINIKFPTADGLIFYLLKRIIKLEEKVEKLGDKEAYKKK